MLRRFLALSAAFALLVFFAACGIHVYQQYADKKTCYTNVYRSPYVLVHFSSGPWSMYGSGFIVKYKEHKFLVSANHVLTTHLELGRRGVLGIEEQPPIYKLLDARNRRIIGLATPFYFDEDRDIAFALVSLSLSEHLCKPDYFEPAMYTFEQLQDLVGTDVYYHGACSIGGWVGLNGIFPFTERVTIARVLRSKMWKVDRNGNEVPSDKDSVLITVKGGVWYGCSGGPLLTSDGKVLGVASCLEEHPIQNTKTGAHYVSLRETLVELFGE